MTGWHLNREQEEAAGRLEGPVLVDAGAGTGKTRMLTARIANAVTGGVSGWEPVSVENVVAITFTDKAAGELAERVRRALRAAGPDHVADARRLDVAWVQTIHGLCSRLLRANAVEAGVDPDFVVIDDVARAHLEEQAFEDACAPFAGEGGRGLLELYDFEELLSVTRKIEAQCRVAGIEPCELRLEVTPESREVLQRAVESFASAVTALGACGVVDDRVSQNLAACDATAERLRLLMEEDIDPILIADEAWRVLADHSHGPSLRVIDSLRKDLKTTQATLLSELASVILGARAAELRDLFAAYAQGVSAAKSAAGALDFDDLQIQAVRLLERHPGLLADYRERFRLVMVDEFQDTDALQLRLIGLLAPGDLCTVGDERQSIYGFRGAQIEVYRAHVEGMNSAGAPTCTLTENYRSHPEVLDFVNDVFGAEPLFGDGFVRLRPARDGAQGLDLGDEPRVDIVLTPKRSGSEAGGSLRGTARAVARRFARLRDVDSVRSSDMAVLLRTYTHADEYAAALRAEGFEVLVLGGRRFFSMREVRALKALCRVVANPADERALSVVLASELSGLSDASLLRLRRARDGEGVSGLWDATCRAADWLEPVESARAARLVRAVERAASGAGGRPLSEVVLRAVEDLDLDLLMLAKGDEGRQTYSNVLKFARLADDYERTGGAGPLGFVEWLERRERADARESPASVVDDGSPAVRIMSIHAAKGLEFPVVAVPGLGDGYRSDSPPALLRVSGGIGEVALRLPASWAPGTDASCRRTPLYSEVSEERRTAEAEERKRLFYVACTRARDVLILAAESPKRQPSSSTMLSWLWSALELGSESDSIEIGERRGPGGARYRIAVLACDEPDTSSQPAEIATLEPGDDLTTTFAPPGVADAVPTEKAVYVDDLDRLSAAVDEPLALSFTGLDSYRRCGLRFLAERLLRVGRAPAEEAEALRSGSAVHAILEVGGAAIGSERIAAIGRFHGLPDQAALLEEAAEAAERAGAEKELAGLASVRREVPFAIKMGRDEARFLLVGSMDAYGRHGDEALVIDYKTGALAQGGSADDKRELQALCYALAAARDGAKRIRVVFVHTSPESRGRLPQEVEYEIGPERLEEFERLLLDDYESMRSGRFQPMSEWDPVSCPDCPLAGGACPVAAAVQ